MPAKGEPWSIGGNALLMGFVKGYWLLPVQQNFRLGACPAGHRTYMNTITSQPMVCRLNYVRDECPADHVCTSNGGGTNHCCSLEHGISSSRDSRILLQEFVPPGRRHISIRSPIARSNAIPWGIWPTARGGLCVRRRWLARIGDSAVRKKLKVSSSKFNEKRESG